ncbi:MAG: response regulator transcription factor [Erysipelotrichaceae bacterium]|nr:response regulator transcription factor [Erysipelotrichaceae bacterium]
MFQILVVEDDKELRELYSMVLSDNGYKTYQAKDGLEALDIIDKEYIDLMLADVMMPHMDGFELTKQLRDANYTLPIIMITAKDQMNDKRIGFASGTDDYMTKPIDVNEMLWRVEALLRRSQSVNQRSITIGSTYIDMDTLTVTYNHNEIILPQKEFLLLYKLTSSIGKIFTRRQIIDEIWGYDFEGDGHTLDVHINRLRKKLEDNPDIQIITIRELGYKVVKKS